MIPRPPRSTLFPTRRSSDLLNQDDARYGFRCCHLKNIWTAPLPPETEMAATEDRKSGSAGMPRPISYAVFCLKKKKKKKEEPHESRNHIINNCSSVDADMRM